MADESANATQAMLAVEDDEIFARWIYQPRFMDKNEVLNEAYVSLRERNGNPNGPEDGLSGILLNRTTHNEVVETGIGFIRKKKGQPVESFLGYGKALVGAIRRISEDNDRIDVIESPSDSVPHHAIVIFVIDGERIRGNTPHPRMRRYKERLLDLFKSNLVRV